MINMIKAMFFSKKTKYKYTLTMRRNNARPDLDGLEKNLYYLEKALFGHDTGKWCWWNEKFPASFQIEFNNVNMWLPHNKLGEKLDYKLALAFYRPTSVSFITCKEENGSTPKWYELMHRDELDELYIAESYFGFNKYNNVESILKKAKHVKTIFGVEPNSEEFKDSAYIFALLSEDEEFGLIVGSNAIGLVCRDGKIELDEVPELFTKWRDYLYDYKRKCDTPEAYPSDWICDTTHILKNPFKK